MPDDPEDMPSFRILNIAESGARELFSEFQKREDDIVTEKIRDHLSDLIFMLDVLFDRTKEGIRREHRRRDR